MLRFSSRLSSISFLERNSKNKLKKLGQATRIVLALIVFIDLFM